MLQVKAVASNVRALDRARLAACSVDSDWPAAEGVVLLLQTLADAGSIRSLENRQGREVALYRGDRFVGVLAHRRSSTSEYGEVPPGFGPGAPRELDLLSHGGVVGRGLSIPPARAAGGFTRLRVLGALVHQGRALRLRDLCARPPAPGPGPGPDAPQRSRQPAVPTLLVCGSAAEVGKTTTCAALIRALKRRGLVVGAAKLTGTGRLRDILAMRDAGADHALDFPDLGLATTYTAAAPVLEAAREILGRLDASGCQVVVAELGGDIIEANADALLADPRIAGRCSAIVHVAGDVVGILGAAALYRRFGLRQPIQPTLPRGRNPLGTVERLRGFGWDALDVLDAAACDAYVERLLAVGVAE